jgi:acyl carrier protein
MNRQLQNAIIQFIADEFRLDPDNIDSDLDLKVDLKLNPEQISDLLQRIQDSLNFTIPDEKVNHISTINDLFDSLSEENEDLGRSSLS